MSDLVQIDENPEDGFHLGVAIAAFWIAQKSAPDPRNDATFDNLTSSQFAVIPLIMHLARIDPIFFDLSKRMSANSLIKQQGNVGRMVGRMAVMGLVYPSPTIGKTTLARDVGILFALGSACRLNVFPTERKSKKPDRPVSDSGSRRILEFAKKNYSARGFPTINSISEIWTARENILIRAGFTSEDASCFSEDHFGTTRTD